MTGDTMVHARHRAVIAALLTLLVTLVAASSAQAIPKTFFGMMAQTGLATSDFDRMGQAKVGTLRVGIDWASTDPTPGSDYNFGGFDAQVRDAAKQGITVLPYVVGTPGWVADLDGSECDGVATNECGTYAPHTKAGLDPFKTFMADLVRRYGPNGIFWQQNPGLPQDPITAWQIWNEQNSDRYYAPKPNVARYAKLVKAGHDGIKSVDPSAEVILGGMFGTPGGGRKPSIAAWDFLEKLYDVPGIKRYFDGVGIHPYAAKLSKVQQQFDLMRDAMKSGHDTKTDIWITELGWASSGPTNPLVRGKKGQAERLTEAYDYFVSKRRAFHIQTVVWYSWQDTERGGSPCEWCAGSGLLDKSGNTKPSFDAYVAFTGGS
jgi:polysaccharide biosynthesis protein PslG